MIDNFLPIPDAESLPLYDMVEASLCEIAAQSLGDIAAQSLGEIAVAAPVVGIHGADVGQEKHARCGRARRRVLRLRSGQWRGMRMTNP